jgi:competence protein ComEA
MLKRLLVLIAGLLFAAGLAVAQEVNKADQAALDSVKGIGPKLSKAIVDERNKNGNFKDWDDFEKRVKGIGDKNSTKMSEAGLTVNGQPKPGTSTAKAGSKGASSSASATNDKSGSTKHSSSKNTSKADTGKPGASTSGGTPSAGASK